MVVTNFPGDDLETTPAKEGIATAARHLVAPLNLFNGSMDMALSSFEPAALTDVDG